MLQPKPLIPKHANIVFQPADAIEVSAFLHDIRRAIMNNWAIIDTTPLQVYVSALVFSPTRSKIRCQFENEEPKWIIQKPVIADIWSACLQTLEGYSNSVNSVAWSHDTARLALASHDKTIKIWDPATGRCVWTLEGHRDSVSSIAWSHDATRLASASDDGMVKIWDPATGQCISTPEGHSGSVMSVAWSHDANRLASASTDSTVKIWDPATGQCVSTLNTDHHLLDILFTKLGTFDQQHFANWVSGPVSTNRSSPIAVGYGLSSNGAWITYQGENLLWLPPEYRPSSAAISGTVVSVGCSTGRVLIFTFSDSNPISSQVQ